MKVAAAAPVGMEPMAVMGQGQVVTTYLVVGVPMVEHIKQAAAQAAVAGVGSNMFNQLVILTVEDILDRITIMDMLDFQAGVGELVQVDQMGILGVMVAA
jgi:hypothetical protein